MGRLIHSELEVGTAPLIRSDRRRRSQSVRSSI